MPHRSRPLRAVLVRVIGALAAVPVIALALAVGSSGASPALAVGSVPAVVQDYVDDGMLARLQQIYGPGASGDGIDFTAATTGAVVRVHAFADAADAADADADASPVRLLNEWAVPVSVDDDAVGVATVWIPPATTEDPAPAPELATFDAGAAFGVALAAVPAEDAVVHDTRTAAPAWYGVDLEDRTATRLDAGVQDPTETPVPTPLADLDLTATADAEPASDSGAGLVLAVVVLIVLIAVIVVVAVLPGGPVRRRAP